MNKSSLLFIASTFWCYFEPSWLALSCCAVSLYAMTVEAIEVFLGERMRGVEDLPFRALLELLVLRLRDDWPAAFQED
jgi:hypothetical protein